MLLLYIASTSSHHSLRPVSPFGLTPLPSIHRRSLFTSTPLTVLLGMPPFSRTFYPCFLSCKARARAGPGMGIAPPFSFSSGTPPRPCPGSSADATGPYLSRNPIADVALSARNVAFSLPPPTVNARLVSKSSWNARISSLSQLGHPSILRFPLLH